MRLVQQHIIKSNSKYFDELINVTHLSKNLYNATLFAIRQQYFDNKTYLNYNTIAGNFVKQRNVDFYALPTKVAQQTLKLVDQNFKSFFGALKAKNAGTNDRKVRIPNYLDKSGKYCVLYTNQAISFKKSGYVRLSGTKIYIKTDKKNIQQIRIVPKLNHLL